MTDVVDPATRSRMMAGIRGANTRPELRVRRWLHAQGFRFTLTRRDLPGRPDIVLPKYNAAVFVHGCFWHAHEGCRYFHLPQTRPDFWRDKLMGNRARDARVRAQLQSEGWRVATIWECTLRPNDSTDGLAPLANWLRDAASYSLEVTSISRPPRIGPAVAT